MLKQLSSRRDAKEHATSESEPVATAAHDPVSFSIDEKELQTTEPLDNGQRANSPCRRRTC